MSKTLRLLTLDDPLFQKYLKLLKAFRRKNGHCLVPTVYVFKECNLGAAVNSLRTRQRKNLLSDDCVAALDAIDFVWDAFEYHFDKGLKALVQYKRVHGDCLVPARFEVEGFKLGEWVRRQREFRTADRISNSRIDKLDGVGFVWQARLRKATWFEDGCALLQRFYDDFGHTNVPASYYVGPHNLRSWCETCKSKFAAGDLTPKQIRQLRKIGFEPDVAVNERRRAKAIKQSIKVSITNPHTPEMPTKSRLGEKHGRARLCAEKVLEIRRWAKYSLDQGLVPAWQAKADELNVGEGTLRDIVHRRTWTHI